MPSSLCFVTRGLGTLIQIIDQLEHLRDVTQDTMSFLWSGVRAWSQYVFDSIGKGQFTWADTQVVQNRRFRLSICKNGASASTNNSQAEASYNQVKEGICTELNVGHCDGPVHYMHYCMYCLTVDNVKNDTHGSV